MERRMDGAEQRECTGRRRRHCVPVPLISVPVPASAAACPTSKTGCQAETGDAGEDVVCGFGPHEGLRVTLLHGYAKYLKRHDTREFATRRKRMISLNSRH